MKTITRAAIIKAKIRSRKEGVLLTRDRFLKHPQARVSECLYRRRCERHRTVVAGVSLFQT